MLYIFDKKMLFFIACSKFENEDKKIFKEKESIKVSKDLVLIKNI